MLSSVVGRPHAHCTDFCDLYLGFTGCYNWLISFNTNDYIHVPVSYTHLDVYKRQILTSAELESHLTATISVIAPCVLHRAHTLKYENVFNCRIRFNTKEAIVCTTSSQTT